MSVSPSEFQRWLVRLVGSTVSFAARRGEDVTFHTGVVEADASGALRVNCGGVLVYPSSADAFADASVVQHGAAPRTTTPGEQGSPAPRNPADDEAARQREIILQQTALADATAQQQRSHMLEEGRAQARDASRERGNLANAVAEVRASQGQAAAEMAEMRRILSELVSVVRASPSHAQPANTLPPPVAHASPTAADASIADLTAEMRRQRGCVITAAAWDIDPDLFARLPVEYRWRSDDETAPSMSVALRSLAAELRCIEAGGSARFLVELKTRLELKGVTPHVSDIGLLNLIPAGPLRDIALAELAVALCKPDGQRQRELLVLARCAPPPAGRNEAAQWRSGAEPVPTEPLPTRIATRRPTRDDTARGPRRSQGSAPAPAPKPAKGF